ncbi:MAG: nucleotidyltransferase family protein [Novosphingobium sp.]|uniref:nucleotidyltransferase family protein n=1 Tax=Novosphingobium sp. TaxID=1874826 RepID=UPI003C79CEF8
MTGLAPDRVLLALLGSIGQPDALALRDLDAAGWDRIGEIAQTHRLGPWLHSLHRNDEAIPQVLRGIWAQDYRAAALTALAQRADLEQCHALLKANGFAPLALKGSFLARHAWSEPALRPMRDIDILVPQDQVLAAYDLLLGHDYVQPTGSKLDLVDHARLEQHMPALQMPHGSWLELHMRMSELDGRLEYATPAGNEAAVMARGVVIDEIAYPSANDMLAHVITHAVYGHRLDCGPLLLGDVRYLIARHAMDWDSFWAEAHAQKWAPGAALVFALVRQYHGASAIPHHAREPKVAAETIELGCDLLVQDWETKMLSRFAATLATGGLGYVWRRITGKVEGGAQAGVTIDRSAEGGRIRWALRRAGSLLRDLADPRVRAQTRQLARYRRWLEN